MPDGSEQGGLGAGEQAGAETTSFESFYGGLDETAKGLIDGHITGLRSALDSERQQRNGLAKQIKELAAKAEKGSELEKQLTDASAKLELAERRATFYEDAAQPQIGCTNAKLAFILAQTENLFDRQGRPDWAAIKSTAPELFRSSVGSADGGAGGQKRTALDMNAAIRRAAGR